MKNTTFKVLNDGFIRVVDWLGSDESISQAARTSYGKGTRSVSDDTTLLRYLMRHAHTSPYEFAQLVLYIRMPIDCHRQFIRHRMSSTNEYSTRYSEAIDSMETTKSTDWRLQSTTNKQGSQQGHIEWPNDMKDLDWIWQYNPGEYLTLKEQYIQEEVKKIYNERLLFGIAREQARKDLCLSNMTEFFWSIDLHNLFHFLKLRMDSHAQLEIRSYANIIGNEIVSRLWPISWNAFVDYELNSIKFSGSEIEMLSYMNKHTLDQPNPIDKLSKREQEEFKVKIDKIGIKAV